MKTINPLLKRRIVLALAGMIIAGISIGFFKRAFFGVDPFQCLCAGMDMAFPSISFGTLYVIVNLVLLSFALILDRRKIGLATLINLFLLGYVAEFSQRCVRGLLPEPTLAVRILLLAVAIVIMCLASAFYFTADLGVSTYDAVALIWSQRQQKIPFAVCRVITDLICVLGGVALCRAAGFTLSRIAGEVGVGTIITAFFMGSLIEFFNRRVARPFLER